MKIKHIILATIALGMIVSCSTTSALEDNEQLFTGLKPIEYTNYENNEHLTVTREELEAALATAPNGALFGSSYYRTPFPYGLWLWNAFSGHRGMFANWVMKSFAKAPVLLRNVNPALRTSVAKSILDNNGYFAGDISYKVIEGKPKTTKTDSVPRPRTAKIQYTVNFGHLYTIDSISYSNYPEDIQRRIVGNESLLHRDDPFSISALDNERVRISHVLRNHGYYFYQPSYTTYLADTLQSPGKVQLQLHMTDSLNDDAMRKWVIGKVQLQVRSGMREQLTDTVSRRFLTIIYGGKKVPLRPRVVLADMKLRPGDLYSQDAYQESYDNLLSKGIFSSIDISFKPRRNADGTTKEVPDSVAAKGGEERAHAGVLDMTINTTLDKPYDVTFQANANSKTNGRIGPGISLGFSKRNAFRGGELLSATIGANYEFQTNSEVKSGNSYDFSVNTSLQMPRILFPTLFGQKRKRWYTTPSTNFTLAAENLRRAGFFTRYILSADMSYTMQPSQRSIHMFTPINITYGHTTNRTEAYYQKIENSVYSSIALSDEMIFKMRYKYIYSSPENYRNPVFMELTLTEAGNITNLIASTTSGKNWDEKNKKVLDTPFSQFLKIELDATKKWNMGEKNQLVAHFFGGAMWAYGNNKTAPFSEQFYIGGANDMRGFGMRSIGPGTVHLYDNDLGYLLQNGNLKLMANLEYRPHLFGSLYGALFLDMGNVWSSERIHKDYFKDNYGTAIGRTDRFDVGIDIGAGIRYDLDFFVLRLDWGLAVHSPYDTGKSGFFNIKKLKDAQCLNFAIGYPF